MASTSRAGAPEVLTLDSGDVAIDLARHTITGSGMPLHLTPTEHILLPARARDAGNELTYYPPMEPVRDGYAVEIILAMWRPSSIGRAGGQHGHGAGDPGAYRIW